MSYVTNFEEKLWIDNNISYNFVKHVHHNIKRQKRNKQIKDL